MPSCVVCGDPVAGTLTCSERCSDWRDEALTTLRAGGTYKSIAALMGAPSSAFVLRRARTPVGPCATCGARVLRRRRYCSAVCAAAGQRAVVYDISPEYRALLLSDPCAYCGRESGTIDHIDSRDGGGADGWENLTAACGRCNSSKGNRPLLQFLVARG